MAVVRERDAAQDVVIASSDYGLSVGDRAASYGAGAVALRIAATAAVAAAVIGPNLPGARSVALVAWHGRGGGGTKTKSTAVGGANLPQGIQISTLVQVAQEEIDDPSVPLFTVYSATATREVIATLDHFDGNAWSAPSVGGAIAVGTFSPSLTTIEHHPPAVTSDGFGHQALVQAIKVANLGGFNIPTWGVPLALSGAGQVSRNGPGGTIISATALQAGDVYAVRSIVSDPSPGELAGDGVDGAATQDLQLPRPVPPRLVQLAHRLVAAATTPYEKALDLQTYLTSSRFTYQLPTRPRAGGLNTPSPGYNGLITFLFVSRTGYCQQFATAFAVLARIDGLPTRIAVGFLPGIRLGSDRWQVDGTDTHAWPQVLFENYGWIDFEPTPGATVAGSNVPRPPAKKGPPTSAVTATTNAGAAHNLHPARPGGVPGNTTAPRQVHHSRRPSGSSAPFLLVVPVLVLAWAAGVPLWRRLRLRRSRREPRAGILAAWGEALRTLDLAGIRRRRAETYLELARRVASTGVLSTEAERALGDLARLATLASYAAAAPPGDTGPLQAMRDARTVVRSAAAESGALAAGRVGPRPEGHGLSRAAPLSRRDTRALWCPYG